MDTDFSEVLVLKFWKPVVKYGLKMPRIRIFLIFLLISLSHIYAGVGFKGINNIEIDSQFKYACFPITYGNWVEYDIGVFDLEKNTLLKGIKISDNYQNYTLSGLTLLSDNVLIANICNKNHGEQKNDYITKLLFIDIDSENIFKTIEYKNDSIIKIKTYKNNIYLLFESGKFIAITESSSVSLFTNEISDIRFPEITINDELIALTHNTRYVSLFNSYSGKIISTIKTESAVIDLYIDNGIIIVLHHNSLEKFSIQGELIVKEDFSEYGLSVCKQLISPDIIFMHIIANETDVYYLYSLLNNQFVNIPLGDKLYISKIIQLNKNRLLLGLSENVGIFQLPKHLPNELIRTIHVKGI